MPLKYFKIVKLTKIATQLICVEPFFSEENYTAIPAISPQNRHRPAPKGTLRYMHSITGPIWTRIN